MTLPQALEAIRQRLNLNQTTFAEEYLEMDQTNYSAFLKGRRRLPFRARCHAFHLGVPAELLLSLED